MRSGGTHAVHPYGNTDNVLSRSRGNGRGRACAQIFSRISGSHCYSSADWKIGQVLLLKGEKMKGFVCTAKAVATATVALALLLLVGCGNDDTDDLGLMQDASNLRIGFIRDCPVSKLRAKSSGVGVLFAHDLRKNKILVSLYGHLDKREVEAVIAKLQAIAANEHIRRRVVVQIYAKATISGSGKTRKVTVCSEDLQREISLKKPVPVEGSN